MGQRYTIPGAYFEAQDSPVPAPGRVRTDVAGFVGLADRGPFNEPVKIESWDQFRSRFGDSIREGLLPDTVRAFFENGGRTCFVVRAGPSSGMWFAAADLPLPGSSGAVLAVRALDPGRAGEQVSVQVMPRPAQRLTLVVRVNGAERERWPDLVAEDDGRPADETRFVDRLLARKDRGSRLIQATVTRPAPTVASPAWLQSQPEPAVAYPAWLQSEPERRREEKDRAAAQRPGPVLLRRPAQVSDDGSGTAFDRLTLAHLTGEVAPLDAVWGLTALEQRPEVSLVAIPDLVWTEPVDVRVPAPPRCGKWPNETRTADPRSPRKPFTADEVLTGQRALIRHCERLRDRFAVLDTPLDEEPQAACERARNLPSGFAALYFPWLRATRRTDGIDRPVPPSGAVTGLIARVDQRVGPYKAPANERLQEVQALVRSLAEPVLAQLHASSVNPIVAVPGRGIRVTGARTLTPPDAPEWRYVSTRRLLLMIEAFVTQIGHEVAFEGNSVTRRADLSRMVRSFLSNLWRDGGLDGANANEAFFVACDERTNPVEEQDAGRLICEIRVKPPAPAEYVVVRIGVATGEAKGVPDG